MQISLLAFVSVCMFLFIHVFVFVSVIVPAFVSAFVFDLMLNMHSAHNLVTGVQEKGCKSDS